MKTVAFVLRSGGDYTAEDVERLAAGVRAHLPDARIVCLSDCPVPVERIPLAHDWPGWWAKMELFRPDLASHDWVYMDLDTIVTGSLEELAALDDLAIMRDVYRPNGLQSAVMCLPAADRAEAWADWISGPSHRMKQFARGGDQAFLETHYLDRALRLQGRLPGQIVSYKADPPAARAAARLVVFHGKPKPRDVNWVL